MEGKGKGEKKKGCRSGHPRREEEGKVSVELLAEEHTVVFAAWTKKKLEER